MLEIKSISTQIGDFRLKNVDFSLGEGECHAVLGPSGSGKSMLLNVILGVAKPTSGRVLLDGKDITNWEIERRSIGFVPQNLGLFPHLSVRKNLEYSARARRLSRKEFLPLLEMLVDITGIGHLLDRRVGALSGGERQRVALVRALAAKPRLVLLDEPFSALNETLRRELWRLAKDLQKERGLSSLLVTHDLTEAYFLAEKITVLINGNQEQTGDKNEIYRHPANLSVARFLGLKNLFPATILNSNGESIEAFCPSLSRRIRLNGRAPAGASIFIGIRPEDVVIYEEGSIVNDDDCVISGTIRAIDMGSTSAMYFHSPKLSSEIEIIALRQLANRYGITNEKKKATIVLPASAIFWFLK